MGFETFCYALADEPDLVAALFKRVGETQLEVFRRIVEMDWHRRHVGRRRPGLQHRRRWCRRMSCAAMSSRTTGRWERSAGQETCPTSSTPTATSGRCCRIIVACGFNAIHPVEPKAMDSREVKAALRRSPRPARQHRDWRDADAGHASRTLRQRSVQRIQYTGARRRLRCWLEQYGGALCARRQLHGYGRATRSLGAIHLPSEAPAESPGSA